MRCTAHCTDISTRIHQVYKAFYFILFYFIDLLEYIFYFSLSCLILYYLISSYLILSYLIISYEYTATERELLSSQTSVISGFTCF